MRVRRFGVWLGAALLALALPYNAARAQDAAADFPKKTIHIVVGFSAGGGNDIFARLIAQKMNEMLKQTVVVDNKPGAAGTIAAEFVARAAPDGYTLLVGPSGAISINPAVYKHLRYDVQRDFAPLSEFASFPLVLAVDAKSPFKTVNDVVEYSKANPGKSNYASSSTAFQLATELFKLRTGAKLEEVTYKGSGDSIMAVIQKEVLLTIADTPPLVSQVKAGQVRALAVLANKRSSELPDVPTIAEQGVPGMEVTLFSGLFAPKKTPAAIVTKLQDTIMAIVKDPDIVTHFKALSVEPVGSTSEEFNKLIIADTARWKEVAEKAHISLELE